MKQESADLDGVVAAPEHHRVLFENDRVRTAPRGGRHLWWLSSQP
jgi:hypothetical protein